MSRSDDRRVRYLGWTLYLLAFFLIAATALEVLFTVWPLQPRQLNWRFGAVGLFTQSLMIPIVAVFLAVFAAHLLEQRHLQLVMAVVNVLLAVSLLAVAAVFFLDAVQLRRFVNVEVRTNFDGHSGKAVFLQAYAAIFFATLAWGGFRAWRSEAKVRRLAARQVRSKARRRAPDSVVVARRTVPKATDSPRDGSVAT